MFYWNITRVLIYYCKTSGIGLKLNGKIIEKAISVLTMISLILDKNTEFPCASLAILK